MLQFFFFSGGKGPVSDIEVVLDNNEDDGRVKASAHRARIDGPIAQTNS